MAAKPKKLSPKKEHDYRLEIAAPDLLAACQRFYDLHQVATPIHPFTGEQGPCICGACRFAREVFTSLNGV